MTKRSMKNGIEVLDDLRSFFEASPAFIALTCEKLRKTHGPTFKLSTVKAILNLRTDLTKEDRLQALKVCEEVLQSFKNSDFTYQNSNKKGIFQNLDTTQAEAIQDKDDFVEMADRQEIEINMNFEDFLKEGGVDLDEIEDLQNQNRTGDQTTTDQQQ